ncbi:HET-domain-containing protein, partial [Lophiostoma macrostomum CBS 122681]
LHNCSTNHDGCSGQELEGRELPTRLVEVRKEDLSTKARLVKGSGFHHTIRYVTLSYRWSQSPSLQLRTDTMSMLTDNIPLSELRELFRNVFEVVLQLGCAYVWIDALCIVQDSQEDWEHEARLMARVYEFAYCNIAAAATTDSAPTLFGVRTSYPPKPLAVRLDLQLGDDSFTGSYHLEDPNFWSTRVILSALSKRGWVVQERFFSPRILHFSYDQVIWECQELKASETFPDGAIPEYQTYGPEFAFRHSNEVSRLDVEDSYDTIIEAWEATRSAYSSTALTYPTDKLFAISGIVKWFEVILKDENVAGLWRKTLVTDLLWFRDGVITTNLRTHGRAPSWSWACLDDETH